MFKNLSIFLTKKRKVFLILARIQKLSNDIGLIAFFQFLIFFFSFTVIFFFIFLEDGPVQHKKKSFTLNFLVNLHVCLNWFLKIQKNLMESQRFIFLKSITPTFKNYRKNKRSKNPITHIISHILWNHKNSRLFIFLGIRG